eukprot:Hpha_TRINITY_DN15719_c2_g1::TRINITY_DN15719_c2_g1_i11::g.36815::m.36815
MRGGMAVEEGLDAVSWGYGGRMRVGLHRRGEGMREEHSKRKDEGGGGVKKGLISARVVSVLSRTSAWCQLLSGLGGAALEALGAGREAVRTAAGAGPVTGADIRLTATAAAPLAAATATAPLATAAAAAAPAPAATAAPAPAAAAAAAALLGSVALEARLTGRETVRTASGARPVAGAGVPAATATATPAPAEATAAAAPATTAAGVTARLLRTTLEAVPLRGEHVGVALGAGPVTGADVTHLC